MFHSTPMLPFRVELRSGESPYRQLVYAATKAIVAGELLPGSPFPSVRVLSQSLKINPNTAQKAVGEMIRDGLLEVRPGIGTVVATWGPATAGERRALLSEELERFLVEARRLGLTLPEIEEAVEDRWNDLFVDGAGPRDLSREESSEEKKA